MMNIARMTVCAFLLGAVTAGAAGCYTTRIHSGQPGTMPSPLATERWHHTLVGGLAEISDPIDLEALCPQGWASIHEELTFLNGLVAGVTESIYTPRTYTVTCAGGAAAPATPAATWAPPAAGAAPAPALDPPAAGAPKK